LRDGVEERRRKAAVFLAKGFPGPPGFPAMNLPFSSLPLLPSRGLSGLAAAGVSTWLCAFAVSMVSLLSNEGAKRWKYFITGQVESLPGMPYSWGVTDTLP
jgi:hypothetical protein